MTNDEWEMENGKRGRRRARFSATSEAETVRREDGQTVRQTDVASGDGFLYGTDAVSLIGERCALRARFLL